MSLILGGLTDAELRAQQVPIQVMPQNATQVRRFGQYSTVGTSFTMVDDLGASTPWMPTVASLVEVVSSSASDAAAGLGARKVILSGLDASFNQVSETVTLNGLTPVASVVAFIRVTKAEVAEVGLYGGSNVGAILTRVVGGGTSILSITATFGQTFSSHFCVPIGYYAGISGANLSTDTGKAVDVLVMARDGANIIAAPFRPLEAAQYFVGLAGSQHYDYEPPIPISPVTDVYIVAKTSAGTAAVSAEYWGWVAPVPV
jgi:hypothetical protein